MDMTILRYLFGYKKEKNILTTAYPCCITKYRICLFTTSFIEQNNEKPIIVYRRQNEDIDIM